MPLSLAQGAPPPPCPAPFNLAAHVLTAGASVPDKIALERVGHGAPERWSYRQVIERVRRMAGGLAALHLPKDGFVLMRMGNHVSFPVVYLASIWAGLRPVPTAAGLTEPEITRMADRLRPALIVRDDGLSCPAAPGCPILGTGDLHALEDAGPIDPDLGDPDRPAYAIFTSGTSGAARAVVHAHRAIWARRMMVRDWYGMTADDRLLHAGAFNWTYTLGTGLLDPWTMGATALVRAADTPGDRLPGLLADTRATMFAAAPGVYRQLLRTPIPDLPHLRHGLSAGEKLSPALRGAWQAATGTDLHEAFGMSECSTFLSGAPGRPAPEGTAGYAQTGRCIALLDAQGAPVPRGTPGTLAVRADDPGLMLGYHGDAAATRARHTSDGRWFLTGDIAVMRADGAIETLGRDDDMMNAGGFRVSPDEVEAALTAHPDVTEAAAIEGRVGPTTTVIVAYFCSRGPVTPDDLRAFASERLADYKRPRVLLPRETLPRSANGKLQRALLRAAFEADNDNA